MSLTNPFGIREREIKKIIKECCPDKNEFYSLDGASCFNTKAECIVSSDLNVIEATLCGTAFDYMARFFIAKKLKNNKENAIKDLCAENIFKISNSFHSINFDVVSLEKMGFFITHEKEHIYGGTNFYLQRELNLDRKKVEELLNKGFFKISFLEKEIIEDVKTEYFNFLGSIKNFILGLNDNEEEIIEKCIILAHLEQMQRSGKGAKTVSELFAFCVEYAPVKNELHRLLDSFKKTFLPLVKPDSEVVFNPVFGIGSEIAGGADADIYIDGTLYDFKVIKKNGWSSAYATQIIGYYLLDLLAKKCEDLKSDLYNYKIDKVALYNVRYEKISYYDCCKIDDSVTNNIIHRISDTYILYKVFYFVRHYDDIIKKYQIPINDNNCLDWNESRAEDLEYYIKEKENGIPLDRYAIEEIETLSEIKNRISRYIETVDTLSIIRDILKKDYRS